MIRNSETMTARGALEAYTAPEVVIGYLAEPMQPVCASGDKIPSTETTDLIEEDYQW